MELMIFDRNINFKGLLEKQFSFRRVRRYSKCGEFELHTSFNLEVLELLKIGNIIWKSGDLEAGYINNRNIKLDEQGKEILVVKGKFLTGYLSKRIIWGTENINDTTENGIRSLVTKHAISPSDSKRKIPLLELGLIENIPGNLKRQVSYRNLLEEVEKIAIDSELGIRSMIDINNKKLIFNIYKGIDRSNKIVFSKEFENVLEQEYTDSVDNYRNVALIAGEGEGQARELTYIGNAIGLDREEIYVDAKDLQSTKEVGETEVPIPRAEYIEMLKNRGKTNLSEMTKIETFDSKVNLKSNLIYKEDFDLGDIVTIKSKKWNLTIDTRITEIEEVYEENGFNVFVTFGNEVPDILDKIKQVVNK